MSPLTLSLITKAARSVAVVRSSAVFAASSSSWRLGSVNDDRSMRLHFPESRGLSKHFATKASSPGEPPFKVHDKEEESLLEEAMKDLPNKGKISTKDLYEHYAEIHGIKKTQAKRYIESIFDLIANAVSNDQQVSVSGFGTFKTMQSKARNGRNPRTGEPLKIPSKTRVKFTPHTDFKKSVMDGKSSTAA